MIPAILTDAEVAVIETWVEATDAERLAVPVADLRALLAERRALREALEFEALDDCACHCCIQRVRRARRALGRPA